MFAVVLRNASTRADVTPEWLASVAKALTTQLERDFCPSYGLAAWHATADAGPGPEIILFDHANQARVLGYHAVGPDGRPYGRVFADGQSLAQMATTFSHEGLELVRDQDAAGFRVAATGIAYADEACDAVEDETYIVEGLPMSNFVLPSWYQDASPGPWDFLSVLPGPHTKTPGGYTIELRGGQVDTDPPAAKESASKRHAGSRTARRLARSSRTA